MDEIKKELKTLYSDGNLTDEELTQMTKDLVDFFKLCLGIRERIDTSLVWKSTKTPGK